MLEYLTEDDVPESLRDVVDAIGIDSLKELVRLVGGSSLYIPSEKSITKAIRNNYIRENFKGDYREVAIKFGLSEVQIRNIINNKI